VRRRDSIAVLGLLAVLTSTAPAQGTADCFPGKESNEARTMAIFAVPLAFGAAAAPARPRGSRLSLGVDITYLPSVDQSTATPTVCRPGKGPENTDLLFAAPRPRVGITLPAGFGVELSWIPPVGLSQVKANLFGVALSRAMALGGKGAVLNLRAHASLGVIEAPITCNREALQDANSECFQGTESEDTFRPNIFGVEAAVGWALGRSLRPYLGAGYNRLAPRFQVNFTDQFGEVDRRKVSVDLNRGILFAGATWGATPALALTGEVYAAPADAITARVAAKFRIGRSNRPVALPAPTASSAPVPGAIRDQ